MKEQLLAKWLNNELSEAELTEFKKSAEYASYERIVRLTSAAKGPEFDVEKALYELQSRKAAQAPKVVRMIPWKKVLRVAAVLVLLFGLTMVYYNTLDKTVSTPYAQQADLRLPDASEVVLNAGSKIRYDHKNWDQVRRVDLEGEAFFKVAKGRTFTVNTPAGQVTVLGTQFNVENRNGYFEVSCYEGLVRVTFQGSSRELAAGATFLSIDGEIIPTEGTDSSQPSWMANETTFRSTPLSYVLDEFERQFDREVQAENIDLSQRYTGSFSNTNINLALQSISTPFQISFKLEGKKVLLYASDTP